MNNRAVLVAAVVILLIPGLLLAQESPVPKPTCKATMELSDEQCAKLAQLELECRMACIKLGAEIEVLQLKMEQELSKDDPSARELEGLVSSIGAARDKLQKQCIDLLLQWRKALGPEQWKQMSGCFGNMDHCGAARMDCMENDRCGVGAHSSMAMVFPKGGQRGVGQCTSMGKQCCCKCCGEMMGGTSCQSGMERMTGCIPGKSACKDVERRFIEIRREE